MRYLLFFLIILGCATMGTADYWTTTDWSDSTTYDSIVNLNGSRQSGNLILDAPDIWNWEYLYSLPGAQNVYDMVISPYGIIFAATGDQNGDVFLSTNIGQTWDSTANIIWAQWAYGLLSSSDSLLYVAYVKSNIQSCVAFSSNPDSGWITKGIPEKRVYCVIEAENYLFAGTGIYGANIYLSNDGGYSWTLKTGFNDDKILCMHAVTQQLLLAGTGDSKGYILRSSDGGENWSAVDSLNIVIEAIIGEIDGMAFLGTSDGRVFSSSDSGLTWSETSILTGANEIKSLFINDKGIVYAGANAVGNQAEVYFSEDNGLSWNTSGNITARSNIPSILGLKNGFLLAGTNVDASIFRAAYFQNGYLISKPYFTGTTNGSTKYGIIQWLDSLSDQTIKVWVRTAHDSLMSTALPWGAGFASVNNGDSIVSNPAVNDSDSYIQYYIKLETDSAGITPFLNEISIEYTIDTLGPEPISAVGYDGIIQQNGIDDDDYVVITFNEPTNEYPIPKDSIDFYLKLNQGSWGEVDTVYWNCEGESGKDTEIYLIVELNVNSTIAVGVKITPDTVIKDIWNNSAYGLIQLTGTFDDTIPPNIISAFASDNIDSIQGIDCDDFVRLIFDQNTNKPQITAGNVNTVLHLSNGHNWGDIDSTVWSTFGETLSVYLDTAGTPTVEPGDTIYPDSVTIEDENGNPCVSPKEIMGTFGDYGPVIVSAVAYDGYIQHNGIDSDDYVYLFFNETTNAPQINSGNIDNILKLNNSHTWNPIDFTQWNNDTTILRIFFNPSGSDTPSVSPGDTIYPDSMTITDSQGQPCIHPVVLTGSFNPGVEEDEDLLTYLPRKLNLDVFPNPAERNVSIVYDIPVRNSISSKSLTRIEVFDVSGRKIKTHISQNLLPGKYSMSLHDKQITPGIYFIKLTSGADFIIRKIIYLR